MSPTDHVRTLRDYAKRSIAYGFEEHFDPDDADDIADYSERLEAALRKIREMHYEGGIDDLEERDDRTYCIVCDALEGKYD